MVLNDSFLPLSSLGISVGYTWGEKDSDTPGVIYAFIKNIIVHMISGMEVVGEINPLLIRKTSDIMELGP